MDEGELIELAHRARENAYAPYSRFKVGAALLAKSGKAYLGCNVENKTYHLTVCAERSAVSSAVCAGETEFTAIAIASASSPPAPPCGSCRQVLLEFSRQMKVIMVNTEGEMKVRTVGELLPEPFEGGRCTT